MPADSSLDIELPSIDQVAWVVDDLRTGMDGFRDLFGLEPWSVLRFEPPALTDMTYRGEPAEFGMWLAICYEAGPAIELIEPSMGDSIYRDHLESGGTGIHHVACFSWDPSEASDIVGRFEDAGFPMVQSGSLGGNEFWYLDTRDPLGVFFEVVAFRDPGRSPAFIYPDDGYPRHP